MAKSRVYIGPPTVSPTFKKRLHLTDGHKDVKHNEKPEDGYGVREIGSDTDETGYGENLKNKAEWLRGLQDHTTGIDAMNPDMKNMQGNPYSGYDIAAVTPYGLMKKAVKDTLKDQVFRKLDQLKELGKIPPEASIYTDVVLKIPGIPNGVTPDQLTDALAEQALEMLKKEEETARAAAPKEPEAGAPAAPGMPPPAGGDQSSAELDSALGELSSLFGPATAATKSVIRFSRERFIPSGETDIKHQKRKMIEQLSKDEEEEVSNFKTLQEPNKETKPYLQYGNGNDNPEGAFAGDPMKSNIFFWQAG